MREYREPHIIRSAGEAFMAGDEKQGYRLLDENQTSTERKLNQPGVLYITEHTGITVGAATDLFTVQVTKNIFTTIWWYVHDDLFTGETHTIAPAPSVGLDTRLSPFVGYTASWDDQEAVTVSLSAGWGWSGGAGPVDFTAYAAVFGGTKK